MELVTLRQAGRAHAGRLDGETIVVLEASSVRQVLAEPELLNAETGDRLPFDEADLAPVIPDPSKIVCVGVNYRDHIAEMGREAPAFPTYFAKYARALIGPYDPIDLPDRELSSNVDWEGELAVVIGQPTRHVDRSEAMSCIGGFTVLNDVSVRDWQRRTTQFLAGKTFEGLTPVGPKLVSADVLGDGSGLDITTTVNGQVKQQSNTSQLVFDVLDIIADLSKVITLDPGDIISTGTPGGVGAARTPPEFLQPGDEVEVTIEGVGSLRNLCR